MVNKSTKEYKLIALDLDGVLLKSDMKVLPNTVKIIKKIHKRGVKIIIVTGKSLFSAKKYANLLGIRDLMICNHGAIIGDPVKNKLLFEIRLPRYALKAIGLMLNTYPELQCYFTSDNKAFMVENPLIPVKEQYHEKNGFKLEKQYPLNYKFEKLLKKVPSKIIFYTPIGKEKKYILALKKYFKNKVNVYRSKPGNVELSPLTVSKGKALSIICRKWKIKPQEAIAVGDEENDISMLKFAGLGVAINNAVPQLKRHADYITSRSNENGGVEEAIKKFIL
ncbi:MAG: hypothetical protein COY66_02810 [Candidatus Kerfeldbacteria bacterium CG_4_10_14_0_8_um_filter_42_10]|uniref:Cof-type HAD-IIB family hydrolase n=1 Tax=Candidatus Kerfeldbacteria bacterium CG_4_10_14_0_8_um_filter_42_10 TaxID=2014248 RepID=A0A2M7RJ89_9BACT|nr:MAG: hypothetical protein COY66_02810 [Candidatus Kerfeldbacteria bacterium CG_4_10_14_0_8_um_filter_42_10]